jgi:glycosyltransferase involved in cell wall biosynthesis
VKILLDLQGAQTQSRTRGIGRYTLSLARAIIRNAGDHDIWVGMTSGLPQTIAPIKEALADVLPEERMLVWSTVTPTGDSYWQHDGRLGLAQVVREAFIADLQPDLVHCSSIIEGAEENSVTTVNRYSPGVLTAATLYDLIPFLDRRYLEHTNVERWYRGRLGELRRADLLLAISESSQQEGREVLGLPADRLVNVRTAIDDVFAPLEVSPDAEAELRERYAIPKPFVMYSGGVDPRKNVPGLIIAFADLPAELRASHQLALVGSGDPLLNPQLLDLARAHGLDESDVIFTGYVSDDDMVALYNLAEAFVFPSLHEGFGLPPLEAMSCGTPTIAADNSSLREVIGNPDALFATNDIAAMSSAMERVLTDETFRRDLGRRGLEHAKSFSWDDCARRTLKAFEKLFAEKKVQHHAPITPYRPRLALVTGLPLRHAPGREQLVHLVQELDHYYQVDIVTDGDLKPWEFEGPARLVRAEEFDIVSGRYDRIVHRYVNDPLFSVVRGVQAHHPGTVLLDDYYLDRVPHPLTDERHATSAWAQAVAESDGYDTLHRLVQARRDGQPTKRPPLNTVVLEAANGVIVTDPRVVRLAAAEHGEAFVRDWAVVPPLVASRLIDHNRHAARSAIASFGDGSAHRHDLVVAAWLGSPLSKQADAELLIVGQDPDSPFGRFLVRTLTDAAPVGSWRLVPESQTGDVMDTIRVVVDLSTVPDSTASRWMHECASLGMKTLGAGDAGEGLGHIFTQVELAEAMHTAWQAKSSVQDPVVLGDFAEPYRDAIEHFHAHGPLAARVGTLHIAAQQPMLTAEDWAQVVVAVTRNSPQPTTKSQLFLDLSTMVRVDARTGIQRVARSLARSLMLSPPDGFRTEPVYSDDAGDLRYARSYGARIVGLDAPDMGDDLVIARPGDVFIGLDLNDRLFPMAGPGATESFMGPVIEQLRSKGVSCQIVVYDLLPARKPDWFPWPHHWFPNYLSHIVRRTDGLLCISQATARDAEAWIKENHPDRSALPVDWFHLGADIESSVPSTHVTPGFERRWAHRGRGPSILMVGTVEPRKGHDQAVAAFSELWRSGVEANLVIVGHAGWGCDPLIRAMRGHHEWGERLLWFDGASDAELLELYRRSNGCLMSSHGEGFGLPLIEAARYDIPVLARDLPVFQEVGGENVTYFSGEDPRDLANSLRRWFGALADGAAPRSGKIPWMTWDESAGQFMEALKRNISR